MKSNTFIKTLLGIVLSLLFAENGSAQQSEVLARKEKTSLAFLKKKGDAIQLMVDNEPFIMISGELHNSSSSTKEYIAHTFDKLAQLNLNSVIASISWEQFEPKEGIYDYSLVDALIENARTRNLKLCLIWFASWKNGQSSYLPLWVKRDTKRFFRVKDKNGNTNETVSPFCEEAMRADTKAFRMLMRYIKKVDQEHTVILMQPENEVGIFQDIDYNSIALKKFGQEVPVKLLAYLKKNKKKLKEEVRSVWQANGYKTKGTWKEVFGDNPYSREFFMTWQYASYINEIVKAGKEEHPLPMFVNAWIVQKPDDLPGVYPNGGPVSRVMDIYKAAAEDIDIVCPDIYLPNFKEIVAMYHRDDNPLLVPESTLEAGRAFYAFGQHDAICYSPFGVEDGDGNIEFSEAYRVLNEIAPLIIKYQGTGNMRAFLKEEGEEGELIELGDYKLQITYGKNEEASYGLIINTGPNEFLVAGKNSKIFFSAKSPSKIGYIGQVWEGGYEEGKWKPYRLLNGDETWHNEVLRVFGRKFETGQTQINPKADVPGGQPFTYSAKTVKTITAPGIYKIITYTRD